MDHTGHGSDQAGAVEKKPRRAAVIGGGFIGLEMAENLVPCRGGSDADQMQNQVMAPLDRDGRLLHESDCKRSQTGSGRRCPR